MKTLWLSLCLCAGLAFAVQPCQAQQPVDEPAAPLMLVYIVKYGDNVLPRIALGLEKPALKITSFEKCVRVSTANPDLMALAVQLKAEDTKTLVAVIKALGAPDARELPNVIVWFATPDNKVLDAINPGAVSGAESNLINGVFMLDKDMTPTIRYLNEKLHPE